MSVATIPIALFNLSPTATLKSFREVFLRYLVMKHSYWNCYDSYVQGTLQRCH